MKNQEIKLLLEKSALFTGLPEDVVNALLPHGQLQTYQPNEIIYQEGDLSEYIYLLMNGQVKITKGEFKHELLCLEAPTYFGGMNTIQREKRTATAIAIENVILIGIRYDDIELLDEHIKKKVYKIVNRIYRERLAQTVEATSNRQIAAMITTQEEIAKRAKLGRVFGSLMIVLFFYVGALNILSHMTISANASTYVTAVILMLMTISGYYIIKVDGSPLSEFGLTCNNWRFALSDSLLWSALFITILTLLVWLFIVSVPRYHDYPLFHLWRTEDNQLLLSLFIILLYVLLSPVQEYIARGLLQSFLQKLFLGPSIRLRAILYADMIFSITHSHLGMAYALAAFIPGLLWGWLYSRHRTLIGCSFSHMLIGFWGTCFLDIQRFF